MTAHVPDLRPYLTANERAEADRLALGAGQFMQNDIRLAELERVAIGRLEDQAGLMKS